MRDISNPVEVLEWHLSVAQTARESIQGWYDSLRPSGEAAVVMGQLNQVDGTIKGLEMAIEALTPEEGKQ